MLWLALHFPLLSLESLPLRQAPGAVVLRGRVVVADAQAVAAGVRVGQKLATALGLLPALRVHERDAASEARALQDLACWAGRFTPTLCLLPGEGLLLEIGGCLRLFGGVEAILNAVFAGCREQGWSLAHGLAPTPLAARWLARGEAVQGAGSEDWRGALAALPCAVTGWSAAILARLESFGLRRLGDVAALLQAALRQRIGSAAVDDWQRAWGELPDPQTPFVFPEQFSAHCELPSRVEHAEGLLFAGQRLMAALAGWLHVRQSGVRACTLQLTHDDHSESALPLHLAEPTADEARLLRLLREHLGRWQLAGPVEALRLRADEVVPCAGASTSLFAEAVAGEGAQACLERLRARLGEGAVQRLAWRADHRPECASVLQDSLTDLPALAASTVKFAPPRPLWLLPEPQALREQFDGPHWHGPLQLLTRAERLEAGWWDAGESLGDQRRDYFIARNRQGQCAWIFRNAQGWFLHGLFA